MKVIGMVFNYHSFMGAKHKFNLKFDISKLQSPIDCPSCGSSKRLPISDLVDVFIVKVITNFLKGEINENELVDAIDSCDFLCGNYKCSALWPKTKEETIYGKN